MIGDETGFHLIERLSTSSQQLGLTLAVRRPGRSDDFARAAVAMGVNQEAKRALHEYVWRLERENLQYRLGIDSDELTGNDPRFTN